MTGQENGDGRRWLRQAVMPAVVAYSVGDKTLYTTTRWSKQPDSLGGAEP